MNEKRRWEVVSVLTLALALLAFLSVERVEGDPKPDAPSYVDLAQSLAAGEGYSVELPGEPAGSRYPPGFPMLLALLSPIADPNQATLLLAGSLEPPWV